VETAWPNKRADKKERARTPARIFINTSMASSACAPILGRL
jgi:hypothetical protein